MMISTRVVASVLLVAAAIFAIERAYGGAGLLDAWVLTAIVVAHASGLLLLWPRQEGMGTSPPSKHSPVREHSRR